MDRVKTGKLRHIPPSYEYQDYVGRTKYENEKQNLSPYQQRLI